jgi:hypothetical protein
LVQPLISLTASNTSHYLGNYMSLRLIRTLCFGAFLAGLPAIIVSSIRGNNEGWVLTFGMITAIAAIILMAVTATTSTKRLDVFNEIELVRYRGRGEDVALHKGVGQNLMVLVELRKVQ